MAFGRTLLLALFFMSSLSGPRPVATETQAGVRDLPSLPDTLKLSHWRALGPVPLGPREGGVEPLPSMRPGGPWPPNLSASIPSWLAAGGRVRWSTVPDSALGDDGRISIERPGPDWEARMDEWSFAGLLNATYAYAEFVVPRTCRALATIRHVSSFRLNGTWFPGAPYSGGPSTVPVPLEAGRNRVLLRFTGYGASTWGTFLLSPIAGRLWVDPEDATLPSLVRGRDLDAPIGLPVWNATIHWSGPIRLDARIPEVGVVGTRDITGIAPFSVRKTAVSLRIPWSVARRSLVSKNDSKELLLVITVHPRGRGSVGRSIASPGTLGIQLVEPDGPRRVSFISKIDDSAQFYALLPPGKSRTDAPLAMIFSLHGAGVDALNQVRSYAPKSWAYVVAPTNRRPFGFDWQDWGRRDALEVLDLALETYPIDPDRVMLTGHSMGGHGTWIVGVRHPDRFAALAPSAGWSHFDLYVPMTLRKSSLLGKPEINALWHRMRANDRVPLFLSNLLPLPVLVLHGGADDNVPPTHGRFLSAQLRDLGGRVTYLEVPDKGHWWDEDDDREGVACVDHPQILRLFRSARRETHPSTVDFRLADLTVDGGRCHWVEVLGQQVPLRESRVRGRVTGWDHLQITTQNVEALLLSPGAWARSGVWRVEIDGQLLRVRARSQMVLERTGGSNRWKAVAHGTSRERRLLSREEKQRCHGLKAAFLSPFILVYGTAGTAEETDATLDVARSLSRIWTYRANGDAPILSDRQALETLSRGGFEGATNYRFVMIGNENCNALLRKWASDVDVGVTRQGITAPASWEWIEMEGADPGRGTVSFAGDVSVAALIEDPTSPGRLTAVFGGTTARSIRRSLSAQPFFSGAGWPDVVIFDEGLSERGWGGLRGAALRTR